MSKVRFTVVALGFTTLCGIAVQAQQPLPTQPGVPVQPTIPGQPVIVQPTIPGNPNQAGTQPSGTQTDQAGRYEARRVPTDTTQQGQGMTVKDVLVQKLQKVNEAEIEIAKMAKEKTENKDVKQLAQTMIEDHQASNKKLQQMSGQNQSQGQRTADRQDNNQNQQANSNRPGAGNQQLTQNQNNSQSAMVPQQLHNIAAQACENSLKMTKDMLSKYEGQDFNMAFLGQQIVAHTMALAELQAIESSGPQELQQFAQEASDTVEKHLESAKKLAKKLEDDSKSKDRS